MFISRSGTITGFILAAVGVVAINQMSQLAAQDRQDRQDRRDREPILQERGPAQLSATPSAISGTIRWVKAGATATSGCTKDAPCGTILAASNAAQSGDTIGVVSGNYAFSPFTTSKAGVVYQCIDANGAPSHLTCKIQPANGTSNSATFWTNTGQNVDINDFEADLRTPNGSNSVRVGLYSMPTGTGPINYNRNHVHHGYQQACTGGGAGLLSDAYTTPEAVVNFNFNVVHDVGSVFCNQVHNIYFSTVGDVIGNVAYNSGGWGIQGWHDNHDNNIINNTSCNNKAGGYSVGSGDYYNTPKPWTGSVVNNIACNNPYGINVYGSIAANQKFSNNLAFGNTTANYNIGSQTCTACLTGPPAVFVNAAQGDYRLKEGSGGIDKGTNTGAPAYDMDGTARPQGQYVDIGAFEYKSGGSTPPVDPPPTDGGGTTSSGNATISVSATSCDGLPKGALYNSGGTAKVCP